MYASVMIVAGLLTGTSFLGTPDGDEERPVGLAPATVSGESPGTAGGASTGEARGSKRCRDQEPNSWNIRVGGKDEPGERMILEGRVLAQDRSALAQAKVYVFHADADGFYSDRRGMDNTNPRLCGILRTDARGRYRVETIRPARYATGGPAPHVHYEVSAAGSKTQGFLLELEPSGAGAASGNRLATRRPLARDAQGVWRCVRDLWLR